MGLPQSPDTEGTHEAAARRNRAFWEAKPILRRIYRGFHEAIAAHLARRPGPVVELGSGIANIREVIPGCICTDISPNPWIDQVENGYALSFADASLSNLVLFDVFHHLRHPGAVLAECRRVLAPGGRVILFEPCMSLFGLLVYGPLHPEPLALFDPIRWQPPAGWDWREEGFYAAQGNASRVFLGRPDPARFQGWRVVRVQRLSALAYCLSGGYSKPQLYPDRAYPWLRSVERLLDWMPWLFATRLLVVLERDDG